MSQFTIFGNPIKHSQSPKIHALFAQQTGISHQYSSMLTAHDNFENTVISLFKHLEGANITAPFKERAYILCQQVTDRAASAGTVNTLKRLQNGQLFGDNTDGIGLFSDLKRLSLIKPNDRILLVGAGGAARAVIQPLLSYGCEIIITNRTFARAQALVNWFQPLNKVNVLRLNALEEQHFDLIINATSAGIEGDIPTLPISLISANMRCYDMFYQAGLTAFLTWAVRYGAINYADGLGMLVSQAAHAFKFWHGVMPEITPILQQVREDLNPIT